MARIHFWQYIVNDTGDPLENVNVRVWKADSPTEEAYIFTHPITGNPTTTSTAGLSTDGNGFVECWFGDELESSGGYSSSQRFKLTWYRAGMSDGYIDNINIYPNTFRVVETDNVSSDKDVKNKLISNQLAYNWESHRNTSVVSTTIHGMEPVDENDTNTDYNKLVSNVKMNHIWSVLTSAGAASISISGSAVREFDVTSWTSSGDLYYADLDHFLNRNYPIVSAYKTSNGKQIQPNEIESISNSRIRIWMPEDTIDLDVTIIG